MKQFYAIKTYKQYDRDVKLAVHPRRHFQQRKETVVRDHSLGTGTCSTRRGDSHLSYSSRWIYWVSSHRS